MNQQNLFGHPIGLFVLFFTEMWERFSYYGMRALLVLYMTQHLIHSAQTHTTVFGFATLQTGLEGLFGSLSTQALASQIYGLYTGLVYFTPLFGGILADRVLGPRKCVIVGSVLMAIGHFLMASEALFLLALLFLILGNGCFKPNISTQVGSLYPPGDPRRDGAFTIFYMGINLGAFFSPLICGTLGQRYGWHYGFGAAGVGMLLGLMVYLLGQKYLSGEQLVKRQEDVIVPAPLTLKEWQALGGLMALAVLNILFWAVYEQQGNTLQLFAEHNTDWHILGWEMPSTWFQSLNPAFIFLLVPLIDRVSRYRAGQGRHRSSVGKMAFGSILLGTSFLVLIFAIGGVQSTEKISFLWLALCTLIYTLGELYLSPVGLSLVSKVSPPRLVGMLMGMWFLSTFFGNYLSGYIGSFYEQMPKQDFFLLLAAMGAVTGLAILAFKPLLKKAVGAD
ncbi:peptide ABC transporter [Methylomonas methanica]|uniref:Peptide ABC transporter n=1 Tax=Methylomonas methanica TaxID=421 RepID=A0A177MVE9_METMH|nr:peptide MFS transporter [Methylomonas methanica]OAI09582.1 peptide ABC transporter [Methylomonas methanica]